MGTADASPVNITITVTRKVHGHQVTLTTWGVVQGRYGSLGRVTVPLDRMPAIDTKDDLARLVLTALYGLDYDL